MINLLPPELKHELRFSRRNALMVHYLTLTLVIAFLLVGSLVAARFYLNQRVADTNNQTAQRQQQIASYSGTQDEAKTLNSRLAAIASIQKNQAKFAELLADLTHYMPTGTAITAITLTGSDKQPVQLTVLASSYQAALSFRDSIARSPRISAADVESVQGPPPAAASGNYTATVVFAFNSGAAK